MNRKKELVKPYYQKYKNDLRNILDKYKKAYYQSEMFDAYATALFRNLENVTRHPLREYQREALYLLDQIMRLRKEGVAGSRNPSKATQLIEDLLEEIDLETGFKAPFIGFEMATGSGKTMLMGASIYLLNQNYGIDNFLIITPSSTDIYAKTIHNFTRGDFESVWAEESPFTFNLITGENYTENLFYNENHAANIFIFNISKFGAKATNTEKSWESSIWRDENGNTISIREFLKNKKLAIITDEAHHAQTPTANTIIKKFYPEAVLEFTATAIETSTSDKKKIQSIVYKYDIRRFLEEGYGKLVRAVALADSNGRKSVAGEIAQSEKFKIILVFLIHLLKKEALLHDLKSRGLKSLAFIKVKNDTEYTQKVYDYIIHELHQDRTNLEILLHKLKAQSLEITNLLVDILATRFHNEIPKIQAAIRQAAIRSIFYHGRCDKETERKFQHIRRNDIEIVVYMQRLDEGINLPHIYTMAVINDTASEFRTAVKQIIGRGVRLNKEQREFDHETNSLKAQTEKLHIVCDQGKNFEDEILRIQKDFGLNDKYFCSEQIIKNHPNKVKSEYLAGKTVPRLKAEMRVRKDQNLFELLGDVVRVVEDYVKYNCFREEDKAGRYFLKFQPNSFFVEVELFAEKQVFHNEIRNAGAHPALLPLGEKHQHSIYSIVQKQLPCLPDTQKIRGFFAAYLQKINEMELMFYKIEPVDELLAANLFVNTFSFFLRNFIERNYYDLGQIETNGEWFLNSEFRAEQIHIPEDQKGNNELRMIQDQEKQRELIAQNSYFFGYPHSVYDYVQFDSLSEKQLADYQEEVINQGRNQEKPFWIRNQRQIYFTYGNKKYYPDFILFHEGIIYILEAKGEIYHDWRKKRLLAHLDKISGYKGVLIFSKELDSLKDSVPPWDEFIKMAMKGMAKIEVEEVMDNQDRAVSR